jgi:hypothetical protein
MKIPQPLKYALIGWVAGVAATVGVGLLWPAIFPAVVVPERYYGPGPGLLWIVLMVVLMASPTALVGGLVGSRIPKEGGQTEQTLMAVILGVILALPCACYGMWFFTGW